MTDHITNPDPHRGPYASLTDDQLLAAYKRVTAEPDNAEAAVVTAELRHRGLVEE